MDNEFIFQFVPHGGIIHPAQFQFFFDIPDCDFNRSAIQNVDVLADERNHNTGHICVSMYGISECTVNNTPQVIAKVDLEPSGRTQDISIFALIIEDNKADVFLVNSVEDFVEVVAELLAGDPFHCFDGFHAS